MTNLLKYIDNKIERITYFKDSIDVAGMISFIREEVLQLMSEFDQKRLECDSLLNENASLRKKISELEYLKSSADYTLTIQRLTAENETLRDHLASLGLVVTKTPSRAV